MSHDSPFVLSDFRNVAEELWPSASAESWDRVGLITGANDAPVRRVLLAVDAVDAVVSEALSWDADALFTHHPLLLRGIHTVAEDTSKGSLLARLIRGNCALIAAHTNADTPSGGVSDVFAHRLGLLDTRPIVPGADPESGIGRTGVLPQPMALRTFAGLVAGVLPQTVTGARVAGDPDRLISRVALLGGAGDSLLDHPDVRSADVYVTSDLRHHPAQESLELSSATRGPALIDVAHWASESLWLEGAAERLRAALPGVEFRVSARCTDPWDFSVGAESALDDRLGV
ncbi:dinuclear metal center YbgI/SA1388 family protein [Leucobacter luti]|uniref:GTP cyclohydrolase 1 type 2 homolog n=1 Tax=Leucobacter luti TaxID=340320 RepID=A0A4R6RRL3_9MICO|nr:Nif3-like dinuclear metal center hexameric protein [Leucobacter luti]TDP89471.1 dinuclear metal center YbgI/SA1388 family protein [Leucobacter luti]